MRRSMYFVPPRLPIEPLSSLLFPHFVRFGFNPEKTEKVLSTPIRCVMDCESFRKDVASSA